MALPADLGVRDTVGDAVPRGDKEDAALRGHAGERPSVWGRGLEALRPWKNARWKIRETPPSTWDSGHWRLKRLPCTRVGFQINEVITC